MLDDEQYLAALGVLAESDGLTTFVQDHWPRKVSQRANQTIKTQIDRCQGQRLDPRDTTMYFQNNHVAWVVAVISTTIAAILLIGAIVTLYLVTHPV